MSHLLVNYTQTRARTHTHAHTHTHTQDIEDHGLDGLPRVSTLDINASEVCGKASSANACLI